MAFSDYANTPNKTDCKIVKTEKEDTDKMGALFICFFPHSALTCTWRVGINAFNCGEEREYGKV
jgi:hypothetical protein